MDLVHAKYVHTEGNINDPLWFKFITYSYTSVVAQFQKEFHKLQSETMPMLVQIN